MNVISANSKLVNLSTEGHWFLVAWINKIRSRQRSKHDWTRCEGLRMSTNHGCATLVYLMSFAKVEA